MKKRIRKYSYHVCMILISLVMLYPLLWMVFSSFKPENQIMLADAGLIPKQWTLEHYINGWGGSNTYSFAVFYKNTIYIAVYRTIAVTLSCSLVAYGFARIQFKGRKLWFGIMIATMALPGMALQIPCYIMFQKMGWVGTFLPLTVPAFTADAGAVFMLMQFMKTVTREMDEAAMIDGCGRFKIYYKIILPLIKPCVVMTAVNTFMSAWNDYYGALIYLNKPSMYPVAYGLKLFADDAGEAAVGNTLAMSVVSLIPIMILFTIFQKQLVEGISTTGVKG